MIDLVSYNPYEQDKYYDKFTDMESYKAKQREKEKTDKFKQEQINEQAINKQLQYEAKQRAKEEAEQLAQQIKNGKI